MDKKGISITEYSALYSMDRQTIEQFLSGLAQANGMEMKYGLGGLFFQWVKQVAARNTCEYNFKAMF